VFQTKLAGGSQREWVCSQIQVCSGEKRDFVVIGFSVIVIFCLCSTETPQSFSSVCVFLEFMNNPSPKIAPAQMCLGMTVFGPDPGPVTRALVVSMAFGLSYFLLVLPVLRG